MRNLFIIITTLLCSILLSQDNRGYIVSVNEQSPNFSVTLNEHEVFDLKKNIGKVIMIQFTASWCSVCLKEMPFIEEEIWKKHQTNNDFVLMGLAKDTDKRPQTKEQIEFMLDRTDVSYPIIRDTNSQIFQLFAEKNAGVTRNIIIDKNGKIAFLTRLFERNEFNEMKEVINDLLSH